MTSRDSDVEICELHRKRKGLVLHRPLWNQQDQVSNSEAMSKRVIADIRCFFKHVALVNRLVSAMANGELGELLKQNSQCALIICDEWGTFSLRMPSATIVFICNIRVLCDTNCSCYD